MYKESLTIMSKFIIIISFNYYICYSDLPLAMFVTIAVVAISIIKGVYLN